MTVLVPRKSKWHGPRGVRVHRTDLAAHEWELRDDIPLTTVHRTAWDVAALETLPNAVATLDGMVRAGSLTMSALQGMALAGAGRWRVTRVRKAVELVDARSESPPESWLRVAMAQSGLAGFVPQFEVWADGSFLGRVDFAWPELKIVVEYEGAYHFDGVQIVRDDRRLRRLIAAGWRVIRISAPDLRDMAALVERIRRAVDGAAAAS